MPKFYWPRSDIRIACAFLKMSKTKYDSSLIQNVALFSLASFAYDANFRALLSLVQILASVALTGSNPRENRNTWSLDEAILFPKTILCLIFPLTVKINYAPPIDQPSSKCSASGPGQMLEFQNEAVSKVINDFRKLSMGKWRPMKTSNSWGWMASTVGNESSFPT